MCLEVNAADIDTLYAGLVCYLGTLPRDLRATRALVIRNIEKCIELHPYLGRSYLEY